MERDNLAWHNKCTLTFLGNRSIQAGKKFVLVRVSIALIKHHNHKQFGKERVISLTHPRYNASTKEVRAVTLAGQNPRGRN